MTVRHRTPPRMHDYVSGWGWLGLLRLGLAIGLTAYALSLGAASGHPSPSLVRPAALALAAGLFALAVAQLTSSLRTSRTFAVAAFAADAGAVLGAFALSSFDPRNYLLALIIVVQAEGGVVFGLLGGFLAWLAISGGYAMLQVVSTSGSGSQLLPGDILIRVSVGLLLALGGGYLADELSGERALRLAEREEELRRLQEAEAKYRVLVEQIPVITYIEAVGPEGPTIYISPQVEDVLGYSQREWTADPGLRERLVHPEDRDLMLTTSGRTHASGEPFRIEYRLLSKDGRVVWVRDEATLLRDDQGQPRFWQGVLVDITDRKRAEEEVAFLAYHDKLTGLPNRAMFGELLEFALARARRMERAVSVLFLDLDNFKLVNDSLGHAAGDELLREMASRLNSAVRTTDIVARQGGDEFLVLLADLATDESGDQPGPLETALAVARRIHDSLKLPFTLLGNEFFITASIGISLFPDNARDARTLLKQADAAMYRSKQRGPAGSMVFATQTEDPFHKLSLATGLRKAVDQEDWVLHYQPIVSLADGRLVGAEALVRWQQGLGKLLGAAEFVPLAEEMGLIGAIGEWVVGELCRQARAWAQEGLDIFLSFNISPRQLWQPEVVPWLMDQIASAGVDPSRLLVEITESTAMRDPELIQQVLDDLHGAGLRLAIDDFGTGYSSLSRLRSLPVDVLKIDRRFVRDVPEEADAASMVRAVIGLAHSLSMQPLAEGIEHPEQSQYLVDLGCSLGQGFLFSPPVPAGEVARLAARHGVVPPSSPLLAR